MGNFHLILICVCFIIIYYSITDAPEPGPAAPQGTTNTAPLPNPWGSTNATTQTSSNSRNQRLVSCPECDSHVNNFLEWI